MVDIIQWAATFTGIAAAIMVAGKFPGPVTGWGLRRLCCLLGWLDPVRIDEAGAAFDLAERGPLHRQSGRRLEISCDEGKGRMTAAGCNFA